jgi:peptidyl-prolyl cis-trans isomerase D
MLTGLRKAGQSWLGKAVVAVLFGLLIVSFAIWGIGDIFRATPQAAVARVGETEITSDAVRNAYQTELQRLSRQTRQTLTPEQARLLGLDRQVLDRLISEAALAEKARGLGLAVSDPLVARSITEEDVFKGATGSFDRSRFEEILNDNNLTEQEFVREQRAGLIRQQLVEALTANLTAPLALREIQHRFANERRTVALLTLPPSAAGEIPAPTEDQIASYFESHKGQFRAPEYRSINAVALDAASLAKPAGVSDEEARRAYERVKGTRFGTPERRTVQQIAFPSREEAEAAAKRLGEGLSFEALAAERGVAEKDLTLGTFSRADLFDPAVAEAAFSLGQGAVSGPVDGRFGPVLLRVAAIEPESVRPFEEVADELKREIANERARTEIDAVHDQIEDLRASARPLAEIAREKGLRLVSAPAVDRAGRDKAGNPVDLPEREALVDAAFRSDVGVDNEALRLKGGGYLWFEVAGIESPREKRLEEVRDEVVRRWRADEIARILSEKATAVVGRLDRGEKMEALAGELGLAAQTVADLGRREPQGAITAEILPRVFAVPVGKAGSAPGPVDARVVLKVVAASVPPFVTSTQEAERTEAQLTGNLVRSAIDQLVVRAREDAGVSVNEAAFRRAIGGEP